MASMKKEAAREFSATRRSSLTAEQKLAGLKKLNRHARVRSFLKEAAFGLDQNRRQAA